jgi:hypothetical protein
MRRENIEKGGINSKLKIQKAKRTKAKKPDLSL